MLSFARARAYPHECTIIYLAVFILYILFLYSMSWLYSYIFAPRCDPISLLHTTTPRVYLKRLFFLPLSISSMSSNFYFRKIELPERALKLFYGLPFFLCLLFSSVVTASRLRSTKFRDPRNHTRQLIVVAHLLLRHPSIPSFLSFLFSPLSLSFFLSFSLPPFLPLSLQQ